MRISDWSSDVCPSDLHRPPREGAGGQPPPAGGRGVRAGAARDRRCAKGRLDRTRRQPACAQCGAAGSREAGCGAAAMTRFIVAILVIANVVTAIGVVSARHEHRQLFVQLAKFEHRSEEHMSELQSLMSISYAVFCLKKKKSTHSPCTAQLDV